MQPRHSQNNSAPHTEPDIPVLQAGWLLKCRENSSLSLSLILNTHIPSHCNSGINGRNMPSFTVLEPTAFSSQAESCRNGLPLWLLCQHLPTATILTIVWRKEKETLLQSLDLSNESIDHFVSWNPQNISHDDSNNDEDDASIFLSFIIIHRKIAFLVFEKIEPVFQQIYSTFECVYTLDDIVIGRENPMVKGKAGRGTHNRTESEGLDQPWTHSWIRLLSGIVWLWSIRTSHAQRTNCLIGHLMVMITSDAVDEVLNSELTHPKATQRVFLPKVLNQCDGWQMWVQFPQGMLAKTATLKSP